MVLVLFFFFIYHLRRFFRLITRRMPDSSQVSSSKWRWRAKGVYWVFRRTTIRRWGSLNSIRETIDMFLSPSFFILQFLSHSVCILFGFFISICSFSLTHYLYYTTYLLSSSSISEFLLLLLPLLCAFVEYVSLCDDDHFFSFRNRRHSRDGGLVCSVDWECYHRAVVQQHSEEY